MDKAQPDGFAHEVLQSIATLYGIEKSVKGQSPEVRCKTRQVRAGPILQALKKRKAHDHYSVSDTEEATVGKSDILCTCPVGGISGLCG